MQDSIDLFLGNYQVNSEEGSLRRSPLQVTKGWKYVAVSRKKINFIFIQ